MSDEESQSVFAKIDGLTEVNPDQLVQFKKVMEEDVIPAIVKIVEARRLLAAESRQRQLKF